MPGMPTSDNLEGVRSICQAYPAVPVVIVSATFDGPTIVGAIDSGAKGFIPKTAGAKTLISALKLVLSGETYIPPALMADFTRNLARESNTVAGTSSRLSPPLSARENDALQMLVQGMTNKEIARRLNLQEITIKMYLRNAYRKIGASSRIDAVRIAIEQGLMQHQEDS
jgi:DNA-binding NarL/FixJ family response regulator